MKKLSFMIIPNKFLFSQINKKQIIMHKNFTQQNNNLFFESFFFSFVVNDYLGINK